MSPESFADFFKRVTGRNPFAHQREFATTLLAGGNVLLRAPTGAGKTHAALLPFLYGHMRGEGPRRLVYALPLRTLVESIGREARELAAAIGGGVTVTTQTGEQADDRFFTDGDIIVTTYDQVLSGLLCAPYGLPKKLANVNAACLSGSLVVFDEFHLMEPQRAFLTAVAMVGLHGDVVQSAWMTATATSPLCDLLAVQLQAQEISLHAAALASLPSVAGVHRSLAVDPAPISAESLLAHTGARVIAIVNTVDRAQALFEAVCRDPRAPARRLLLHSRFFRRDRKSKEAMLHAWFARDAGEPAVLVSTQVIEAGVDISCDHLHTEVCPVNALVQRAGRCARFAPLEGVARGTVHVHPLADGASPLPYDAEALAITWQLARDAAPGTQLEPGLSAVWVEHAHAIEDARALRSGVPERRREGLRRVRGNALGGPAVSVSDLIRAGDDSVRVLVDGAAPHHAAALEGVPLRRGHVIARLRHTWAAGLLAGWAYSPGSDPDWIPIQAAADMKDAYVICLRPAVAAYDSDIGLRIGATGTATSPVAIIPPRPGYGPLRVESWVGHARAVAAHASKRVAEEGRPASPLSRAMATGLWASAATAARASGLLHDVGKLQRPWQAWAEAAQRSHDPRWKHRHPLAHTDYDSSDPADRARERALHMTRPPHAAASAFVGAYCVHLLMPREERELASSAVIAAALSHHGGWLRSPLEVAPLAPSWFKALTDAIGATPPDALELRAQIERAITATPETKGKNLSKLLAVATGPDAPERAWPLVAYLMRTLRLSDQRATAEGSCDG